MVFNLISTMPLEIKEIIYYYISDNVKSNLTKKLFIDYYEEKRKTIPFYKSYIRYLIRNNHEFIFRLNVNINRSHWFNLKNWKYNNKIYSNYLCYLKEYANRQNQNKMYQIIKSLETKRN
jgi:hypothetical protein